MKIPQIVLGPEIFTNATLLLNPQLFSTFTASLYFLTRLNPYIAGFYLLLSLTFVLPIRHLHVCTEKTTDLCQNQGEKDGIASFHDSCELCDLVFSPDISPENTIELQEALLLGQHAPLIKETLAKASLPYLHLRAPPLG